MNDNASGGLWRSVWGWVHAPGWAVALALTLSHTAHAAETQEVPVVRYNVALAVFESELPHGKPFFIQFTVSGSDADNDEVAGLLWEGDQCAQVPAKQIPSTPNKTAVKGSDQAQVLNGASEDKDEQGKRKFVLTVPPLRYDTSYCWLFTLSRDWGSGDRASVNEAVRDILKASVQQGSYDEVLIKDRASASLGSRGKLEVLLAGGAALGPKTQPLLDVVTEWFQRKPLQPLFDAHREYWNNISNARNKLVELTRQDTRPPLSVLGDNPPPAAIALDAAFDKLKEAGEKAPRLTEVVSTEAEAKRRRDPPEADSEDERTYLEYLNVLEDRAKEVAILCAAPASRAAAALALNNDYCKKVANASNRIGDVKRNLGESAHHYKVYNDTLNDLLEKLKEKVDSIQVRLPPARVTTSLPSYTERSAFYVSADVGGVLSVFHGRGGFGGQDLSVFLGVNVYLTAVDKDTPLAKDDGFLKRFSFTTGWTLTDVQDSSGRTKGVLDGKGILVGCGIRATDYLRLGAGAMFVRQEDRNPVVSDTHLRAVPYVATSIDLDVAGTLRDAFSKYQQ
jgi:hypothetical protein